MSQSINLSVAGGAHMADHARSAPVQSRERKLIIVSPQADKLAETISAEYRPLQIKPINKMFKGWAEHSFRY